MWNWKMESSSGIPAANNRMSSTVDIQYIKGIGPKRAEVLAKAGLATIEDLFEYFPRRYIDRRQIVPLGQLQTDGEEVTVIGKVEAAGIRYARKRFFYIVIRDETGLLEAIWFNAIEQFKRVFSVGDWVALSGKVSYYRGYQMTHPDFDKLGGAELDHTLHTGKILPLYPGSDMLRKAGINSYTFRRIFFNLLQNHLNIIKENLPEDIVSSRGFLSRRDSFRFVHDPDSGEHLDRGLARLKYEEFFFQQLLFALQRNSSKLKDPGIAFLKPSPRLEGYYKSLPFTMTAAQKKAVKEIRADMKSPHPMNRLLQGDVGSGKTLVATMAMLLAVDNGYQAALMVPTEILAEQHYFNISRALGALDITVRLLRGSTSSRERKDISVMMESEEPMIVIGTHALIQEKISFRKLGLVVVDEQHRFGVMQRASLTEKGINADVLIMTATPIPRTLALSVYGGLDVSVLDEMPPGRMPIQTVWRFDDKASDIYEFIRERVLAGEQAYIVFPLVEESEKMDLKAATESFEKLKKTEFRDIPVTLLHGRLSSEEKETVMGDFNSGRVKILVSTTVIEVGIDVKAATIMLIEHAERFGLSQLHQLRGRVGRGDKKSFCILKTPFNISETAQLRMKIMTQTTDGFKIAEEDLKLRGWGDFFGKRQSGMPAFKLANPIEDRELLNLARRDAFDLIKNDPQLRKEENEGVRFFFIERYQSKFLLSKVS